MSLELVHSQVGPHHKPKRVLRRSCTNPSRSRSSELDGLAELLSLVHGMSDEVPGIEDKNLQCAFQALLDRAATVIITTIRHVAFADAERATLFRHRAYRGS